MILGILWYNQIRGHGRNRLRMKTIWKPLWLEANWEFIPLMTVSFSSRGFLKKQAFNARIACCWGERIPSMEWCAPLRTLSNGIARNECVWPRSLQKIASCIRGGWAVFVDGQQISQGKHPTNASGSTFAYVHWDQTSGDEHPKRRMSVTQPTYSWGLHWMLRNALPGIGCASMRPKVADRGEPYWWK